MSVSAIVREKLRGNSVTKRKMNDTFLSFFHRCKMVVTWLYAILLISVGLCSLCRGQRADINI